MDDMEKHTDPLEDFFRKNLEDYSVDYDERDWEKLEKRLDIADARANSQPWMKWAAAAAILLACLAGYFIYENYNAISQLNERLANENSLSNENTESPGLSELNNQGQTRAQEEASENTEQNFTPDQQKTDNPALDLQKRKLAANNVQAGKTPSRTSALDITAVTEFECMQCQTLSSVVEPPALPTVIAKLVSDKAADNESGQKAGRNAVALKNSSGATGLVPSPNIRLGLVVGPDLSTAGSLSGFESPGYKLGISADITLGRRFAISTGVIHSNVRYTARGSEYQFPSGYVPDGIVAQKTFAECAILEIPLALKYRIMDLNRSAIFISTGLSSYIMLNEDYQFTYADKHNPDNKIVREWSTQSGRAHIFSNASISVGYEQVLNDHLGIQIQPYVNFPLAGVGAGNVNLYSAGVLFSLNYRLR